MLQLPARRAKSGRRKPAGKGKAVVPEHRRLIMTTVWLTPEHMTLIDEICFYVSKNSLGSYRPNRSELIRLMIENLASSKRKLKRMRTPEEMKKALVK